MIDRLGRQAIAIAVPLQLGGIVCAIANPIDSAAFVISILVVAIAVLLVLGGIAASAIERRLLAVPPPRPRPSTRSSSR